MSCQPDDLAFWRVCSILLLTIILWFLIFIAIASLARADPIRVTTDHGGLIADYIDDGRSYAIVGTCESACTMRLALPPERLCVAPGAWLGFHAGTDPHRVAGLNDKLPTASEMLWAAYPSPLRARLGELTAAVVYLRGRDLIAMGYRPCK